MQLDRAARGNADVDETETADRVAVEECEFSSEASFHASTEKQSAQAETDAMPRESAAIKNILQFVEFAEGETQAPRAAHVRLNDGGAAGRPRCRG